MSGSTRLGRWAVATMVVLGLGLVPAIALAQTVEYSAMLSSSGAVPAVTSDATGTFDATFDVATGTLTYALVVPSIADATQAHIHAGAAGEAGPVVVPLFASDGPVDSIDVTGAAASADLLGPYAGDPAGFAAALNNGTLYVNVHTTANLPGEIRGQIEAGALTQVAPPAAGNAGIAGDHGGRSTALTALLVAATVALLLGGRRLALSRRRTG